MEVPSERPNDSMDFFKNLYGQRLFWSNLFDDNILINEDVVLEAKNIWDRYIKSNEKVLGVLARGTDYTTLKPSQHPVQPSTDQLISDIKQRFFRYDIVFVATEDIDILRAIKEEIGDKVFYQEPKFQDYKGGFLSDSMCAYRADVVELGREYLVNMLILSWCDGIIAGRTSGSVGVAMMRNNWDDEKYYDLGRYL